MSYVLFPSTLKPTGLFSTHEDIFGKGGFVSLTGEANNLTEESDIQDFLNTNIIEQRRKLGMLVYISSIKRYYTCSSVTGEAGISGDWDRQYFSGRYFHGPSAPTEQDIQIGERWFDTIAGTEYTYIPIQEGSDQYAWVDIDHIGSGGGGSMIYFYGDDAPTEAIGATIGSKWFNTELGAELTLLPNEPDNGGETGTVWVMVNSLASGASGDFVLKTGDTMSGTLTADRAFRTSVDSNFSSNEFVTKSYVDTFNPSGNYVLKTGDTMSGTLTGTTASFSNSITAPSGFIGTFTGVNSSFTGLTSTNGFIGTLTGTNASFSKSTVVLNSGSYENQPVAKIQKIDGNTDEYSGYYPGTTGFMNLPRLVLEHNPSNSWGWPSAIDFVTRPTAQSDISSISHRIGNLFSTGGISRLIFWGAPAQNTTYGGGITGLSAGLSGEGLTALGYFQYAVGATDSGFYALRAFKTSSDTSYYPNEFITKKFFQDNEYRTNLPHVNIYITATKGNNDEDNYQVGGPNWAHTFIPSEIGAAVIEDTNDEEDSLYAILSENNIGFPKPWKVKVKRSFYRGPADAPNYGFYLPPHSTRSTGQYPQSGNQTYANPAFARTYVNTVTTTNDIIIRWNGYKNELGGARPWFFEGGLGCDTEGERTRIKIATAAETLNYGDTYITEIIITPG